MKTYKSGRRYEYKVVEILKRQGYIVSRNASSQGLWDVVGIRYNGERSQIEVVFVQVTAAQDVSKLRHQVKIRKNELASVPQGWAKVRCEVWGFLKGKGKKRGLIYVEQV